MDEGVGNGPLVENFRDVGLFINLAARSHVLAEGRLLRGGSIRRLESLDAVGGPQTVLNLQAVPDRRWPGVTALHFPAPMRVDVYDTRMREVRMWLRQIVRRAVDGIPWPLYAHCYSGRDRTGVVIASLLRAIGIDEELVVEEYGLSDGIPSREAIRVSLEGIADPERYFAGIRLERVAHALRSEE